MQRSLPARSPPAQVLSVSQAKAFYAEHVGRPFYETLVAFMSSGPIVVMELAHAEKDVVGAWRELLGPTDSNEAREVAMKQFGMEPGPEEEGSVPTMASWSVRAAFGTDKTRNACHGSDSAYSAQREVDFFFGESGGKPRRRETCRTPNISEKH